MKTKILVCSDSGIADFNKLNMERSIDIIPNLIEFSQDEKYIEYVELSSKAFYNRVNIEASSKISFSFIGNDYIINMIEQYISLGFDQFLFIASTLVLDYIDIIKSIMEKTKVKYYIYDSLCTSYPLAYLAMEADKSIKENTNINEIIKDLDGLSYDSNIIYFAPNKDEEFNVFDDNIDFSGKVYKFNNDSFTLLKSNKKALNYFLNVIYTELQYSEFIPFIVYTNEASKYYNYIKMSFLNLFPNVKEIKSYQLSPSFGIKYGFNLYGIGYVLK